MIDIIRKKEPRWHHPGPEATARGFQPQEYDAIAWGDDWAAHSVAQRGWTKAMREKFKSDLEAMGLTVIRLEVR